MNGKKIKNNIAQKSVWFSLALIGVILLSIITSHYRAFAVGKVTSEGDRALASDVARSRFNVDGTGIKIGVISTSFDALKGAATDVASGDLPGPGNPNGFITPVQVLRDLTITDITDIGFANDEGRALLQLVHDIAPGAELLFHTVVESASEVSLSDINNISYATAVEALAQAGADIIVDDSVIPTTIFQDGIAAQTVNEVVKQGIVYISAAGNNGNRSYESQFRPGATFSFLGSTFEAHDFDPGNGVDLFQDIQTPHGRLIRPLLTWDEPSGQVSEDYEMFLLDSPALPGSGGTVLTASTSPSLDTINDPLRTLGFIPSENETLYLLIARRTDGAAPTQRRIKWISIANGFDRNTIYQYVNDTSNAIGGSTVFGQANAKGAIAVGAADFNKTPAFGDNLPELEDYSSRGGAPILFDPQGNQFPAPQIRHKPDIVGPDAVSTNFDTSTDFNPIRGTSAAAPQVAGVVALMLERAGGSRSLTPAFVRAILQQTARALAPQESLPSMSGFVQAMSAVAESDRARHYR